VICWNLLDIILGSVGGNVVEDSADGLVDVFAVGKVIAGVLENT